MGAARFIYTLKIRGSLFVFRPPCWGFLRYTVSLRLNCASQSSPREKQTEGGKRKRLYSTHTHGFLDGAKEKRTRSDETARAHTGDMPRETFLAINCSSLLMPPLPLPRLPLKSFSSSSRLILVFLFFPSFHFGSIGDAVENIHERLRDEQNTDWLHPRVGQSTY